MKLDVKQIEKEIQALEEQVRQVHDTSVRVAAALDIMRNIKAHLDKPELEDVTESEDERIGDDS